MEVILELVFKEQLKMKMKEDCTVFALHGLTKQILINAPSKHSSMRKNLKSFYYYYYYY